MSRSFSVSTRDTSLKYCGLGSTLLPMRTYGEYTSLRLSGTERLPNMPKADVTMQELGRALWQYSKETQ